MSSVLASGLRLHSQNVPIPANSLENLNRISSLLNLNSEGLSNEQTSDLCFNEIYNRCQQKQWDVIKLLKKEIDILVNSLGYSLLVVCILQKDKDLFEGLIQERIALHCLGPHKNLPLHYAAAEGHFKFVTRLCEVNEADARTISDHSPLHLAAFEGHLKIVILLSTKYPGLCPRQAVCIFGKTELKLTPLALSVLKGHVECVRFFLEKDPSLAHCQIKTFGSIVHLAIAFHQNQVLEILLNRFHELFLNRINEPNDQGQTPLMVAALCGNEEAIYLLNKRGALLDATDGKGDTALHYAVKGNQKNAVLQLIKLGANPRILNQEKLEPYTLAATLLEIHGESIKTIAAIINNTNLSNQSHGECLAPDITENLALQGGGPKGIGLIGALQEINLTTVKRVAGTSAGSINASLVAVGYSAKEIEEIMENMPMMNLLDVNCEKLFPDLKNTKIALKTLMEAVYNPVGTSVKIIKKCLKGLWNNKGICKGEVLREEVEKHILRKTGIPYCTFKDLRDGIKAGKPYKHLYVFATAIGLNPKILDIHSEETLDRIWDNVPLSDAVRGSSGIPGVYEPFRLHIRVNGERVPLPDNFVVVDGGILNNLPLERFDRQKYISSAFSKKDQDFPIYNKRTLGLSFLNSSSKEKKSFDETNMKDFVEKMVQVYWEAESLIRNLNPYSERRIIKIDPLDIGTGSFMASKEQKAKVIQSGKSAVKEFYKKQQDDFSKYIKKEEIKTTIVPMAEIGRVSGFYVFIGKWKYCEISFGETFGTMIRLHEFLANHDLFDYFEINPLKIAFCECEYNMIITTLDKDGIAKDEPKKLKIEKGRAEIIEIFTHCKHLKFEIKKV